MTIPLERFHLAAFGAALLALASCRAGGSSTPPPPTLAQQTVASTRASTTDDAKSVQDATGLTVSLFEDFTKVTAPSDGTVSAATLARMVVVTTQQQTTAIASTVGTTAIDGATI